MAQAGYATGPTQDRPTDDLRAVRHGRQARASRGCPCCADHIRLGVGCGSRAADEPVLRFGFCPTVPDGLWMRLGDAADFAGVAPGELVDAIAARELAATTTHRQRPGDTLVRMLDVEIWRRRKAA